MEHSIDREKVIKGLDEIMHYDGEQMFYNDIFIRGIADDALALLKEQKTVAYALDVLRKHGWREGGYLDVPGESGIVRCKDCKYRFRFTEENGIGYPKCELKHNWMPQPDWFCADGERKKVK